MTDFLFINCICLEEPSDDESEEPEITETTKSAKEEETTESPAPAKSNPEPNPDAKPFERLASSPKQVDLQSMMKSMHNGGSNHGDHKEAGDRDAFSCLPSCRQYCTMQCPTHCCSLSLRSKMLKYMKDGGNPSPSLAQIKSQIIQRQQFLQNRGAILAKPNPYYAQTMYNKYPYKAWRNETLVQAPGII